MTENLIVLFAILGGLSALLAIGVVVGDFFLDPLARHLERRRLEAEYDEATKRG
jgi:hypothetical protein